MPQNDPEVYVKATIAIPKQTASIESFDAITTDTATANGQKVLTITGLNYLPSGVVNERMTITIPNFTGAGTFGFGHEQAIPFAEAVYFLDGRGTSYATSGTVTITTSKETMSGTFSFTCNDSVKLDNGTFSMPRL